MIYKNAKVGEVEGVTILRFGDGSIKMGPTYNSQTGETGIAFAATDPGEIGRSFNDKGQSTDEVGIDVYMSFDNEASLDVLLDAVIKAKVQFKMLQTANAKV
jgi:hypothetical protein